MVLFQVEGPAIRAPSVGPSTLPMVEVKSALRVQLERDLLTLVYRSAR